MSGGGEGVRDIYLDNNATTELDERVLSAMLPVLRHVGNPSSAHPAGQAAHGWVENARRQVAALLDGSPREIVFTSGSTEANNLALKGLFRGANSGRRRIVSVTTEHPAILETLRALAVNDADLTLVPVDRLGIVDLQRLADAVDDDTLVVTVMAANNETGVLAPLPQIAEIAHARGAVFHTDATQLLAWGGVDVDALGVDLLSLSGHKMHGPQGVGALYVRRECSRRLIPIQHGGGHERGMRSGTLNTAGIVGLGVAAEIAMSEGPLAARRVQTLRDRLHCELEESVAPVILNGHPVDRLPGTLNLSFPDADADAVMAGAPAVAVATGSACSTGHPGPSHVLTAMGVDEEQAACSLRFGLSRFTTVEEVTTAVSLVAASVARVRNKQPEVASA
jgi:cysteine desulfurase